MIAALVVLSAPAVAAAQLTVEIEAPEDVREGERAQVIARVRGAGPHPLLITPRSEGTAIEVVRGRLLRAEARDPDAEVLEFRLPIVARGAGDAVLRVRAQGYVCEARCRATVAEASAVLRVRAAPSPGKRKQAEARRSSLSWVRLPGAEGCVGSAELARAVEARLERRVFVSATDAGLAVEGRVERTDAGWRAVLQVAEAGRDGLLGDRTLTSEEEACDQIGELAAVTIALMIDPLTAPEETPPPLEEAPREPPEPEVRVVREVEIRQVEVPAEPEAPPPGPRWRIEVDASGAASLGLSPTAALGGLGAVILEIPGFVPILVEGAIFPFSEAQLDRVGAAQFLHVQGGFQICPLAVREGIAALHGCLGADAGGVFVIGGSLDVSNPERVIGQARASVRGHFDLIGPLTLRVGLHLVVPFRHDAFLAPHPTLGGQVEVYVPEPIAGILDVGVGAHFDF